VSDTLTIIAVVAGFALFIVIAAKLGGAMPDSLSGMFALDPLPARPQGVQEDDLPRFVFHDTPWRAATANAATSIASASPASSTTGQLPAARAA
jgi:hypothetical protein